MKTYKDYDSKDQRIVDFTSEWSKSQHVEHKMQEDFSEDQDRTIKEFLEGTFFG